MFAELAGANGPVRLNSGASLQPRQWYRVWLSADPNAKGRPRNFRIPVRDVRAYTGAGFIVPLCGDMLQMPGLGKQAAGFDIDIDKDGKIVGMF